MREHAAVGERLRRLAERVDERVVPGAAVADRAREARERARRALEAAQQVAAARRGAASPAIAATQTSSVNTSRSAISAALGSSPSNQTATKPGRSGRSSASAGSVAAASSSSRTRSRWWETMRSVRSRRATGSRAPGISRPAGGWKWMPFGASSSTAGPSPANALGGTPCARANARENAASEP